MLLGSQPIINIWNYCKFFCLFVLVFIPHGCTLYLYKQSSCSSQSKTNPDTIAILSGCNVAISWFWAVKCCNGRWPSKLGQVVFHVSMARTMDFLFYSNFLCPNLFSQIYLRNIWQIVTRSLGMWPSLSYQFRQKNFELINIIIFYFNFYKKCYSKSFQKINKFVYF